MIRESDEKPHFTGWENVPEHYQTKTTLRKNGLKPRDETEYDATLRAYQYSRWRDFYLYEIGNCIPIKKRNVRELEFNDKNIAESLYVINKSAKKSRDTKNENYYKRNHNIVQSAKTRQNNLYDLKDKVINKLLEQNTLNIIGYHKSMYSKLLLVELSGYTFHVPTQDVLGAKLLGELDAPISAEATKTVDVGFYEAVNLLERYINL